jgi:hypothetical protein
MSLTTLSNYIDPYSGWRLSAEGGITTLIGDGEPVDFSGGKGIDVTRATNDITISLSDMYDNYGSWNLTADGSENQITSGYTVNLIAGDNVSIDKTTATTSQDITINSEQMDWTWNGFTIDDTKSILTVGGNGLTSNSISETGNIVTTTYHLGTPSTLTGSTTNNVTADSHTHEIDLDLNDISDVVLEGQGSPSLASGQLLQFNGQEWINKTVSDVLTNIPVTDKVLKDTNIYFNNYFRTIYDAVITDSRESGKTYEINLIGGYTSSGIIDIEIRWYNLDQAGWHVIGDWTLSGVSASDETFEAKVKVTLRSGNDASGYDTFTYLNFKDQAGNDYMYRLNSNVSSSLTGAGEECYIRVSWKQSSGSVSLQQGETKVLY